MVKIQGARERHAIVGRQDHFGRQATYCSCSRDDDDFIQSVDDVISGQD